MSASASGIPRISELNRRLLFTLFILIVYRLGVFIPVPGISPAQITQLFERTSGTAFDLFNVFSGGALEQASIFALGVIPYITASILMSLMVKAIPSLEALQKEEGQAGRRKINQYSRYGTVPISIIQATVLTLALETGAAEAPGLGFRLSTILTLTSGSMLVMWLGEQISEKGIGNGVSLIITMSILAGTPGALWNMLRLVRVGDITVLGMLLIFVFLVFVMAIIVFVETASRKIPIQHPRKVMGRKMMEGGTTHLPLKINPSGVIPPIFASSLLIFPATLVAITDTPFMRTISEEVIQNPFVYNIVFAVLIIFFSFFYTGIVYDPNDLSDNIKNSGANVPGIRPGAKTSEYIGSILNKITLIGSIYLVAVCVLPSFLQRDPFNLPFYFGGTSLLIIIGVTLDFMQRVQSFVITRNYDSFATAGGGGGARRPRGQGGRRRKRF
ncbi:MAG: preprotein translocase subunit SecY [Candidatus Mycalebacterium zealandia]|nr:MAG: preprotein translocase subunit SecY [Candidatus Mycalebacterium zealandia]